MMYPDEIKIRLNEFAKAYNNGEFSQAEKIAETLLSASIEARIQSGILATMNVGVAKKTEK